MYIMTYELPCSCLDSSSGRTLNRYLMRTVGEDDESLFVKGAMSRYFRVFRGDLWLITSLDSKIMVMWHSYTDKIIVLSQTR